MVITVIQALQIIYGILIRLVVSSLDLWNHNARTMALWVSSQACLIKATAFSAKNHL